MYSLALILHSWLRWAVLPLGIAATFAALTDPTGGSRSGRWGLLFTIVLDIQMLLGLLLYVALSPVTAEAFKSFREAMHIPALRFWAVEHSVTMLAAVVVAHLGRVLARSAATPASRRLRESLCFGLSTIAMIVAVPWPGTANGRPLFRV